MSRPRTCNCGQCKKCRSRERNYEAVKRYQARMRPKKAPDFWPEDLDAFIAMCGSQTKAAARLHVTPNAVCMRLKRRRFAAARREELIDAQEG